MQNNVIGDRVDTAKALRAQAKKLEPSNSNKEESMIVRTPDEKSNVVFRFSNPESKIKSKRSNESDTNQFLNKYLRKLDREAVGLWSRIGQPYIGRGEPDLGLIRKAYQSREARKHKLKRKTLMSGNSNYHWGGSGLSHHQKTSHHSRKTLMTNVSNDDYDSFPSALRGMNRKDMERYSFPKEYIIESEMRCKQSKNGVPYAKIIQQQANKCGALFDPLTIADDLTPKAKTDTTYMIPMKIPDKLSRHSTYYPLGLTAKSTHRSLAAITENNEAETEPEVEFQIDGTEITKWSEHFQSVRDALHKELYDSLANAKFDRIDVYQNAELLGLSVKLCSNPSECAHLPKMKNIWSKAKQIQKEQKQKQTKQEEETYYSRFYPISSRSPSMSVYRTGSDTNAESESENEVEKSRIFYRSILCFMERVFGGNVLCCDNQQDFVPKYQRGVNAETMELVTEIKQMLQQGLIADHTFFYELFVRYHPYLQSDSAAQNQQILQLLSFILHYFEISAEDFDTFLTKNEFVLSSPTKSALLERHE